MHLFFFSICKPLYLELQIHPTYARIGIGTSERWLFEMVLLLVVTQIVEQNITFNPFQYL